MGDDVDRVARSAAPMVVVATFLPTSRLLQAERWAARVVAVVCSERGDDHRGGADRAGGGGRRRIERCDGASSPTDQVEHRGKSCRASWELPPVDMAVRFIR